MKGKYGDSIRASTNTVHQTIKYLSLSLPLPPSQRTPGYVINVLHESSWKNEYRRSLAKSLFTVPLTDLPAKSLLFGQYSVSSFPHSPRASVAIYKHTGQLLFALTVPPPSSLPSL